MNNNKRIHCFRHVSFEGLECIEDWCNAKSYPITYTDFYDPTYSLPNEDEYDVLIVIGGPMGVYEEDLHPWLQKEKKAIDAAIQHDKTILGICLGAQLIAEVLGARVYKNTEKEIGWWKVALTDEIRETALFDSFPKEIPVFQWHGDTFDLPDGTTRIGSSDICLNQGFVYKEKVVALQFHFEVTQQSIQTISDHDLGEIAEGGNHVQSVEKIQEGAYHVATTNRMMYSLLDRLIG